VFSVLLGKDDFVNGVINPKVEVPKLNKKGEPDGTRTMPRRSRF